MSAFRSLLLVCVASVCSCRVTSGASIVLGAVTDNASALYTSSHLGLVLLVDDSDEEIGHAAGAPTEPGRWSAWVEASSGPAGGSLFDTFTWSQVDVPSASIRVSARGVRGATAHGNFSDELTFTNTTGATAFITADFFVNGVVQTGTIFFPPPRIEAALSFAGASFLYRQFGTEEITGGGTWESYTIGPPPAGNAGASFQGIHAIPAGESTVSVPAKLELLCGVGHSCDFTDTARLGLALPDGVTFTSASGVLLTDVSSPVPEPSVWLLSLTGLAVFGGVRLASRLRSREAGSAV